MRERSAVRLRASFVTGAGPLLVCALVAGCRAAPNGGSVCTDLFAFVTAAAVDTAGGRLTHVVITDSIPRTGHVFVVTQQQYPVGTVTAFSDSYRNELASTADTVGLSGTSDQGWFVAQYVLRDDGCHIQKLAGPDTVIAR